MIREKHQVSELKLRCRFIYIDIQFEYKSHSYWGMTVFSVGNKLFLQVFKLVIGMTNGSIFTPPRMKQLTESKQLFLRGTHFFGALIEGIKKRNKLCQLGRRPKVVPPLSSDSV